jgi:hypothetical protein
MSFIVETGSNVANANSLASVEFADAYHAARGNAAWATLDLANKQYNLIKATDYFALTYRRYLLGAPAFIGQALPFPRIINYVNVGNPLDIQNAIAELALISSTLSLMPNASRTKKRVKVGPIEVEYDANSPSQTQFVAASLMVAPWLSGQLNGHTAKLVRT